MPPERPRLNPGPVLRSLLVRRESHRRCQACLEAQEGFDPFSEEVGRGLRDLLGNSNDILSDVLVAGALRVEKQGQ